MHRNHDIEIETFLEKLSIMVFKAMETNLQLHFITNRDFNNCASRGPYNFSKYIKIKDNTCNIQREWAGAGPEIPQRELP